MSRVRIAALTASFNYVQYGLAIASGLLLVPLTIGAVGARSYGLWLATGELLGYAGMVDLGVLGVLPWMVAEADGRRDRTRLRELVANGAAVGAVVGLGYATVAGLLWTMVPVAVNVPSGDRSSLAGPLLLLVAVTAAVYPLRTFTALLTGLQDALFNGMLSVAQSATYFVVAATGLWRGWGLYALAIASAASMAVGVGASLVRALIVAPDLLTGWPRPRMSTVRVLLSNGIGVWIAGFGWRLVSASTSMVIAVVGRTEWVAIYACTSKLSAVSTQVAWVLPDSGLVGLSQLHGEGHPQARVRAVVMMIVRLHLVLAGAAACAVLAFNPAFVTAWVGAEFYGGHALTVWLAGWNRRFVARARARDDGFRARQPAQGWRGDDGEWHRPDRARVPVRRVVVARGNRRRDRARRADDLGPGRSGAPPCIDRAVDPFLLAGAALALAAADCAGGGRLRRCRHPDPRCRAGRGQRHHGRLHVGLLLGGPAAAVRIALERGCGRGD